MLHAFCYAYDICIYDYLFVLINCGMSGFGITKCFCPFSHIHLHSTLCTQSHREAVAPVIGNLGEASSQLS